MGGGGSLDSMNKTIQRNRALLNRKTIFESTNNRRYEKPIDQTEGFMDKPADPKVLDLIRHKVLHQRRWQLIKGILIFAVTSLVIAYIIYQVMSGPPMRNPF